MEFLQKPGMLARALPLVLLLVPAAIWSQEHGEQYRDSISWGQDKETFKVTLTIRQYEGLLMVSAQGFRSIIIGAAGNGTSPIPWNEIRSWSCGPRVGLTIAVSNHPAGQIGLKHGDLLKVVNQYLRKYAPDALDSAAGCSPDQL